MQSPRIVAKRNAYRLEQPTLPPPFDPVVYARETDRSFEEPTRPRMEMPRCDSDMRVKSTWIELASVPVVVLAESDQAWFDLSEAERLVLEHVDGQSTVQTIVAVAGLPVSHALQAVRELIVQGVIALR
jgi:hypothetical protein